MIGRQDPESSASAQVRAHIAKSGQRTQGGKAHAPRVKGHPRSVADVIGTEDGRSSAHWSHSDQRSTVARQSL